MGWLVFYVQYLAFWLEGFPFYLPHDRSLCNWFFSVQLAFHAFFTLKIVMHNGQLQVSFEKGEYGALATAGERNSAAAKSAI